MKNILIGVMAFAALSSQAAVITWTDTAEITGASDIITAGSLVQAGNFGATNSSSYSITAGGETIAFEQFFKNDVSSSYYVAAGSENVNAVNWKGTDGQAGFVSMMDSLVYSTDSLTFRIKNLEEGQKYQIQLFMSQDWNARDAGTQLFSDNSVMTDEDANNTDAITYGPGSFVIGEFTAQANGAQTIFAHNVSVEGTSNPLGLINGFVLRSVPEPATLGLITAFGGGILFIRRRFMM